MESSLFKHVRTAAGLTVLCAAAWIGWTGIHRSLWLDEAWIANSLRAGTWGEMWWGGEWLQTSPPLFLALARAWTSWVGLSTESLRIVSLFFALLAVLGVEKAAIRAGAGRFAALAGAALAFPALGIEYFGSFKQYAGEAAASALLLWAATSGSLVWITFASVVLMGFAYPLLFMLPGIVLLVWSKHGMRAASGLAAACAVVLAGLYVGFMSPNVEASLWSYWEGSFQDAYSFGVILWVAACAGLAVFAARKRDFLLLACALPGLLLVVAECSGWYPASPRMRLFARPCFLVGAAIFLEREVRWERAKWVAAAIAIGAALFAAVKYRPYAFEDYPANIAYLQKNVKPGELVLIHADARQGFELYSAIDGWEQERRYGDTGWPCCARGRAVVKSSEAAVRADLARLLPAEYRGRLWLVYANRPLHWKYLGLDEGDLWRRAAWDRGCEPTRYRDEGAIVISEMNCKSR